MNPSTLENLRTCPCCGLLQQLPALGVGERACCTRCRTTLARFGKPADSTRTTVAGRFQSARNTTAAAFATAALIVYLPAIMMPILRIEQMGHRHESSILQGVQTLLVSGQWFIGIIVLLCSIIIPILKLAGLLTLTSGGWFLAHEHKALTYRLIEWTGRWGMLDVLLVALLVAALKLGDIVEVTAGPGAVAFAGCVVCSLLASAFFEPRDLWKGNEPRSTKKNEE